MLGTALPVLGLLALLGWASLGTGGPAGFGVNQSFGRVEIESALAANFTLELMDGGTLDLGDLRGKVVLVDFWASWCEPCRFEAATLDSIYREYADQPLEFVGVNIWDQRAAAAQFMKEFDVPYPIGVDESGVIAVDYGVAGIPEKFFIDADGVLRRKFQGPMPSRVLRETLDELLAGVLPNVAGAPADAY